MSSPTRLTPRQRLFVEEYLIDLDARCAAIRAGYRAGLARNYGDRLLRNYGQRVKYYHSIPGTNSRLDTLQAAVLSIKLPHLDGWNAARRRHAEAYSARLGAYATPPAAAAGVEHIYHLYVIEVDDRGKVEQHLRAQQVQTGIHYPVPAHLQEACARLGYKAGAFPVTEAAASRILSLPMFAELTDQQIDYVADAVAAASR